MEFGLMVEPQVGGTYRELLDLAQAAEAAGFTSFARSDHYLAGENSVPATDALTTIAGLARETESIKLTVLVTPLTFRHPAVIAKTATTLDEMSGGRFELGVGTGWQEAEHRVFGIQLPEVRTRFSLLFETLAYIHAVIGRSDPGYVGRHHHLENVEILPHPVANLPIIVGGKGKKKTPSIAGRFADEYNLFPMSADDIAVRRQVMETTARELGRDPATIKLSITTPVVVGEDEAEYQEMLGMLAAQRGIAREELAATLTARRFPHGTYEQASAMVRQFADEGIGRIYVQHFAPLREIDAGTIGLQLRALSS